MRSFNFSCKPIREISQCSFFGGKLHGLAPAGFFLAGSCTVSVRHFTLRVSKTSKNFEDNQTTSKLFLKCRTTREEEEEKETERKTRRPGTSKRYSTWKCD